ncbi:MAG: hypothetical protein ACLGJB_27545 [Blastocatellia bacterium]
MNRNNIPPFIGCRKTPFRITYLIVIALAGLGLLSVALKGKSVFAGADSKGFISVEATGDARGEAVAGEFTFTISHDSGEFSRRVAVAAGASTLAIEVPSGTLSVTEEARDGFEVSGVTAASGGGEDRLVSSNPATRTATVTVVAGDASTQTLVRFTNRRAAAR